jgi:anti-sigma regulatory factor (Ser/Thr protein kinase)
MEWHPVQSDLDVFGARRGARAMASAIGFPTRAREELVIVVSELATNIVKYGVRGAIGLEECSDERRGRGIRVTARDEGPPIGDLATALQDGHSARGPLLPEELYGRRGIGAGLGAVVRFSDSFDYRAEPGGKRICVTRFLRR